MYLVQWLLNAFWTPLFFALHQPGWALAEILILLAAILTTIYMFWRVRRTAALLLIPYALWTAFAAVLNCALWSLNI